MTDNNQKQQDDQKGGVNPIVAGVAGAVVGAAAVGAAGAAILANDDNRKKVEEAIDQVKGNVADMKEVVSDKIAEGQEKVNEVAAAIKDSTDSSANGTK